MEQGRVSDIEASNFAYRGELQALKNKLSEDNALLSKPDQDRRVPLHWAASGGRSDVVEYLLHDCQVTQDVVNAVDDAGWTPLMIASSAGRALIVSMLLSRSADVDVVNLTGQTALHYAASKDRVKIVEMLVESGATATLQDRSGNTALHRAASKGHTAVIKLIAQHQPQAVDIKDCEGNTALHLACEEDRSEAAMALVELGANISTLNKAEKSPLSVAGAGLANTLRRIAA